MESSKAIEVAEERVPSNAVGFWARGGIKRTLRFYIGVVTAILFLNLFWLLWARLRYKVKGFKGTIWDGDCEAAHKIDFWLHLFINILSTLLLTGSNIFMAVFSSPSRKELDKAHAKGEWLNIGLLSLRNLLRISWKKSFVCIILMLSSVPFHLLYNSMVYSSISANQYNWIIAPENYTISNVYSATLASENGMMNYWLEIDNNTNTIHNATFPGEINSSFPIRDILVQARISKKYQRESPDDCAAAYKDPFRSDRRNVIVLIDTAYILQDNRTSSLEIFWENTSFWEDRKSSYWMCNSGEPSLNQGEYSTATDTLGSGWKTQCDPTQFSSTISKSAQNFCLTTFGQIPEYPKFCKPSAIKPNSWIMLGGKVKSCLVEKVESVCAVKFDFVIIIVVIVLNILKLSFMGFILHKIDAECLLISAGDAAISFLKKSDPWTAGICLANRRNIDSFWPVDSRSHRYSNESVRWGKAASRWRIAVLIILQIVCVLLIIIALSAEFLNLVGKVPTTMDVLELGFGTLTAETLFSFSEVESGNDVGISEEALGSTRLQNLLFANSPQLILSIVALSYNSFMSAVFAAQDWDEFAHKPQTFMVAAPKGLQRSTWLLGTPWKFGSVVFICQALLHWILSRAIFPVQIRYFDAKGKTMPSRPPINMLGYSAPPTIVVLSIAVYIIASIIFMSTLKSAPGGTPVVSTCSAAISAACHSKISNEEGFEYKKLRWGEIRDEGEDIGHCSFVTQEMWDAGLAGPPTVDKIYR